MTVAVLQRPRRTDAVGRPSRQDALRLLAGRLEEWLRAEESLLSLWREGGRKAERREAHWRAMLGLYERVCLAAAPAGN